MMTEQYEPPERQVYAPKEFISLTGLSRAAVYRGLERGEIPSVRIGGRILIPKDAADRLLTGNAA